MAEREYVGGKIRKTSCVNGHELIAANVYVTPDGTRRFCRLCHRDNTVDWARRNVDRLTAKSREWRKQNPEKYREQGRRSAKAQLARLKADPDKYNRVKFTMRLRRYGLNELEFDRFLDSGCCICGEIFTDCQRAKAKLPTNGTVRDAVHIEHSHKRNVVRGLAHGLCNVAIGAMLEDPAKLRKAAEYCERWA